MIGRPARPLQERRQPKHPQWLERFEIVAEVTGAEHCANFIRAGQRFVFDLQGLIKPDKSTANLCLGMLARLQSALLMAADRAALGVHPISDGWQTFDCFDTGVDHGGMGKVCVRMHLQDSKTGAAVDDATRA